MNPLNIVHFRREIFYNWRNWETLYHDLSVRKSHQNVPSFRELPLTGSFVEEWYYRNTDSFTYNWCTEPGVCITIMMKENLDIFGIVCLYFFFFLHFFTYNINFSKTIIEIWNYYYIIIYCFYRKTTYAIKKPFHC